MQPTAARSRLRMILRVGAPLLVLALAASGCLLPPAPVTEEVIRSAAIWLRVDKVSTPSSIPWNPIRPNQLP